MVDGTGHGRHMVGLTGSFGSGCSYIAEHILKNAGYRYASLSDTLKDRFQSATSKDPDKVPRSELQDFGDGERSKNGSDFYAKEITQRIQSEDPKAEAKWVIDSIRNPKEVSCFRDFWAWFNLVTVRVTLFEAFTPAYQIVN
jgi:dephospho-CoA kinase